LMRSFRVAAYTISEDPWNRAHNSWSTSATRTIVSLTQLTNSFFCAVPAQHPGKSKETVCRRNIGEVELDVEDGVDGRGGRPARGACDGRKK